jgi:hypothetical protein
MEGPKMTRTITISELKATGIESWSVKDNSVRGIATKYTSEVNVGDKVVIDNYFTLIIE